MRSAGKGHDMNGLTYDKLEQLLWYGAGVLCIALLVIGILIWRRCRALSFQWGDAYGSWKSSYAGFVKRHDGKKDGAAQ